MLWFRLASHLGMSLQEVQQQTTSSEFVEWVEYLDSLWNVPDRKDYLLANIAAEVCRTRVKRPASVKVQDFILKFSNAAHKKPPSTEASKAFWFAAVGVKKGGAK